MTLLAASDLVKSFGGFLATDRLAFDLREGEIHAIIGPNGAGKTTFMNLLSGDLLADRGRIIFAGRDVASLPLFRRALSGIARSFQISSVFHQFSVLENVMLAVQAREGHSFSFWRPVASDRRLIEPALDALTCVGLESEARLPVSQLAHGARRQLEIAMALAMRPKVLLLDEPMAGMSQLESLKIVELLLGLKGKYSIVLVEHDMDAVFTLADRITVMVQGRHIACGTPEEIRCNADVKAAYLGDMEEVA